MMETWLVKNDRPWLTTWTLFKTMVSIITQDVEEEQQQSFVKASLSRKIHQQVWSPLSTSIWMSVLNMSFRMWTVYWPPLSQKNKLSISMFSYFSNLLEGLLISPHDLITGDFNFHVDSASNWDACSFFDLLDSMALQHVEGPTQRNG